MAERYRTKGFVLSKKDLREADQLFTVFTQEFGKINVLGRSIRKINSKLRAGLDLFYLSQIEFIQGKSCKTLTDAFPIKKCEYGFETGKIAEVLNSEIKGEEKDEKIWALLTKALEDRDFENFLDNLTAILGYGISTNLEEMLLSKKAC